VTVARTNLPTFFSRIWSHAALAVRTSATAEAYNPSNSASVGSAAPIVARGVKPFLLPNCDPGAAGTSCGGTGTTFINTATGAMTRPGQAPAGVIGETFTLQSDCGSGPGCIPGPPQANEYYPVTIPPTTTSACPSCFTGLAGFEEDIACSNPTPLTCSTTVGSISTTLAVDTTVLPEGGGGDPAKSGVECLIHQQGGNGQDILNGSLLGSGLNYPLQIQAGHNHPLAGGPINSGDNITTSDSLVTVPLYDDVLAGGAPTGPVQIIGFVQLFINQMFPGGVGPKAGSFQVTVVNVSGCGSGVTGTPVYTGSSSPVPVRLIH
jgi:hypothetical protein